MSTVSIDLPESASRVFGDSDADRKRSILTAAVVKWYEMGRISQGKAAEILGISRSELLDLLSYYQVSVWQYTAADLEAELGNSSNGDLKVMVAAKLYEHGILSLGHAAELAGLSKRDFMSELGKFGVSIFNYPASDLDRDIANAKNYRI